jgi:hypothetical protein
MKNCFIEGFRKEIKGILDRLASPDEVREALGIDKNDVSGEEMMKLLDEAHDRAFKFLLNFNDIPLHFTADKLFEKIYKSRDPKFVWAVDDGLTLAKELIYDKKDFTYSKILEWWNMFGQFKYDLDVEAERLRKQLENMCLKVAFKVNGKWKWLKLTEYTIYILDDKRSKVQADHQYPELVQNKKAGTSFPVVFAEQLHKKFIDQMASRFDYLKEKFGADEVKVVKIDNTVKP